MNEAEEAKKMNKTEEAKKEIEYTIDLISYTEPYIYPLYSKITTGFSHKIDTMGVNTDYELIANPDFVLLSPPYVLEFALIHEIIHIIYDHPFRAEKYSSQKADKRIAFLCFNIAADAVVNYDVSGSLFNPRVPPAGAVTYELLSRMLEVPVEELMNKTEEEIADMLYGTIDVIEGKGGIIIKSRKTGESSTYKGDISDIKPDETIFDGIYSSLSHDEIFRDLKSTLDSLKSAGEIPAGIIRRIEKIYFKRLPWHFKLSSDLGAIPRLKIRRTYRRPSRKYAGLPGYELEFPPRAVALIDTSGSIEDAELSEFLSYIYSMLKQYNFKFDIYCWDGDVYDKITAETAKDVYDIAKNRIKGGGGTVPDPALVEASKERADVLIIFTDGMWSVSDKTSSLLQKLTNRYNYCMLVTTDKVPDVIPPKFIIYKMR